MKMIVGLFQALNVDKKFQVTIGGQCFSAKTKE